MTTKLLFVCSLNQWRRGCREQGQSVIVAGTPVQFLPPDSPLTEEASRNAVTKDIEGLPVRVFSAEYLAAVALHVGRPKDRLRLVQFLEFHALEETRFKDILKRHRLMDRWVRFKHQVGLA